MRSRLRTAREHYRRGLISRRERVWVVLFGRIYPFSRLRWWAWGRVFRLRNAAARLRGRWLFDWLWLLFCTPGLPRVRWWWRVVRARADLLRQDRVNVARYRRWRDAWHLLEREMPPRLWCYDCDRLVMPAVNHRGDLLCPQCGQRDVIGVR